MARSRTAERVDVVRDEALPVGDHDALLDLVGDRRVVLLGEATHGSTEFYVERRRITERLVAERGFTAVAVEADFPDARRAGLWAEGRSSDRSADDALGGFQRFPSWMWRNVEVVRLLEWLRRHNAGGGAAAPVGFWGLDLYSLHGSIDAVLRYLELEHPDAVAVARERYGCFDHVARPERPSEREAFEPQAYGQSVLYGLAPSCEDEVVRQLVELQEVTAEAAADDDAFAAVMNASVVTAAEEYYREMFRGRVSSWNVRDEHMARTLEALWDHLSARHEQPGIVVWEHNSHIGDARATEMGRAGELNVGQLVRQRWGDDAALIGFTTYDGAVTAADDWGGPARRKRIVPAMEGSIERLLHDTGRERLLLPMSDRVRDALDSKLYERAIGVVYRPQTERISHWFHARPADQFDAIVHIDRTSPLAPLDPGERWVSDELPETYPFAV